MAFERNNVQKLIQALNGYYFNNHIFYARLAKKKGKINKNIELWPNQISNEGTMNKRLEDLSLKREQERISETKVKIPPTSLKVNKSLEVLINRIIMVGIRKKDCVNFISDILSSL